MCSVVKRRFKEPDFRFHPIGSETSVQCLLWTHYVIFTISEAESSTLWEKIIILLDEITFNVFFSSNKESSSCTGAEGSMKVIS